MSINDLIPSDKSDIETAENLKKYSYQELKEIILELLTWIQDMNWPVAGPVAEYLESISEEITKEIIKILQGTDGVWKYWCVNVFAINAQKQLNSELIEEIIRISKTPTKDEMEEEVQKLAIEFLNKINKNYNN